MVWQRARNSGNNIDKNKNFMANKDHLGVQNIKPCEWGLHLYGTSKQAFHSCRNKVLSWVRCLLFKDFWAWNHVNAFGWEEGADPVTRYRPRSGLCTCTLHEPLSICTRAQWFQWTMHIERLHNCMNVYCILQSTFANLSALHWLFASHLDVAHPTSCVHNLKLLIVLWLVPYWGVLLLYIWAFEHQHRS